MLRQHPLFPRVALLLSEYVHSCIPRPAETERTFWAVSAMPGTHRNRHGGRLFTLCINKMETLFVAAGADDHGNPWLEGHLNVSRLALTAEAGSLTRQRARHPNLRLVIPGYESGGGDVIGLRFVDVDGLLGAFQMPGAIKAARTLNLMLMRKGPTFQWRWHNYDLADWAFRDEPDPRTDRRSNRRDETRMTRPRPDINLLAGLRPHAPG